ncbi:MAG: DNA recombination protein RmuC [Candidatus Bipolaricaulota bacterium]|nr:DNA recombination protein RmuC [Candidatus Bipolaricaulota bacterium]
MLDLLLGGALGLVLGLLFGVVWATRRGRAARLALEGERDALARELADLRQKHQELQLQHVDLQARLRAAEEKAQWLGQAREALEATFKALASDVLTANAQQLVERAKDALEALLAEARGDWGKNAEALRGLLVPLREALEKLERRVQEVEAARERAFGSLTKQLEQMALGHSELRAIAGQLVQALRSPTARGRWGEVQLRRIVELAGLQRHIDFAEQVGTDRGRPDLIVYLPNGGQLAVDAKAPMDAFLRALEAPNEEARRACLNEHAERLLGHMRELGKRGYWASLERAPDLVVMFVPSESCVAAAFEARPELLEEGWRNRVVVASPTLLFALLRTVAYAWQQQEVAEEAQKLAREALELIQRFATFGEHFKRLGDRLGAAVEAYNEAAGSMRRRLLPLAQRYAEQAGKELPEPPEVPRPTPFEA